MNLTPGLPLAGTIALRLCGAILLTAACFANAADFPRVGTPVALAPTLLAVDVLDGEILRPGPEPYIPQEGDELKPDGDLVPVWNAEGIVREPFGRKLIRNGKEFGKVFTPRPGYEPMLWRETTVSTPLDLKAWLKPESYRITANDGAVLTPVAIRRKSQPANDNLTTGEKVLAHRFYLVLPEPLKVGAAYRLSLPAGEAAFTYEPQFTEHEAIHINQIGYRPDDPFKRAFLSLWLGDGEGWIFDVREFEIIEEPSGRVASQGKISEGFPASQNEAFREPRNFVGADVHYLDFHEFRETGTFRIRIPGVGVSRPFAIGAETWLSAFRKSLHGLLSHRSGIKLGEPLTTYERPRPMHPGDGVVVFRIPHTMLEGEADTVQRAISEKLDSGEPVNTWPLHPGAWGGYMDAGDWDRRSQHLSVSRHLVELFQTNPQFFEEVALDLPEDESKDKIPDLLNEALWNIAFYRRLQEPDGGVGGGVESTQHPRPGERSWEETLVLAAFAPDPLSSLSYASAAALLSSAIAPYDRELAGTYRESAEQAWKWALENADRVLAEADARTKSAPTGEAKFDANEARQNIEIMRFVAAADLYQLTGSEVYGAVVKEKMPTLGDGGEELGAAFRLAMWPPEQSPPELIEAAKTKVIKNAESSLAFGKRNAFGIHTQAEHLPMMGYTGFFSVPETITGPLLPRAYLLTGDQRFLRGALHAAHFSAGANPLNKTFTTGVGHDFPRHPLHIDSRMSGRPAPDGITIYGPSDPAGDFGFNEWVHRWHLGGMHPPSRTWPAAEWCVDMFLWPAMSEYTVHQTFRPTAYAWGFLASRSPLPEAPKADSPAPAEPK